MSKYKTGTLRIFQSTNASMNNSFGPILPMTDDDRRGWALLRKRRPDIYKRFENPTEKVR